VLLRIFFSFVSSWVFSNRERTYLEIFSAEPHKCTHAEPHKGVRTAGGKIV